MAIYYPIGRALVPFDELLEKSSSGQLGRFVDELRKAPRNASMDFQSGRADAPSILETLSSEKSFDASGEAPLVPWKELGLNKPLTIEIRHVYTGNSPDGRDMLLTSAFKGMTTYDAAPRAVNQLSRKVGRNSQFQAVPATDKGTFLVFYSPAILDRHASLTLEIGFDRFRQEVFDTVASAFDMAAKVPIFLPYSGLLVAAGLITKLVGKVGEALVDGSPYFSQTESLNIFRPGTGIPEPGFRLIAGRSLSQSELQRYHCSPDGLVDASGNRYSGPHPYVIISLDGTPNDEYQDFTATAASAAILERFYRAREGAEIATGVFLEAVKLYNDWQFRSAADRVAAELKGLDPASEDYADAKARLGALVKSIVNTELKPELPA